MINRRRIVRSPRFETAPSFCLPPVDFCSGVSPSQAAKSRPAANPSAAGTSAVMAVETIGPKGIDIARRSLDNRTLLLRHCFALANTDITSGRYMNAGGIAPGRRKRPIVPFTSDSGQMIGIAAIMRDATATV